MHYLAWVVANTPQGVDEIMAPYCEELHEPIICTEAAIKQMRTPDKYWEKHLAEGAPDTLEEFCEWEGYGFEDGEAITWTNPIGFWDWFIIGGRWDKRLIDSGDTSFSEFAKSRLYHSHLGGNVMDKEEALGQEPPFSLVTGEGAIHRETYERGRGLIETPSFTEKVRAILSSLSDGQSIFVVDYHS